jgi:hypothetical protein
MFAWSRNTVSRLFHWRAAQYESALAEAANYSPVKIKVNHFLAKHMKRRLLRLNPARQITRSAFLWKNDSASLTEPEHSKLWISHANTGGVPSFVIAAATCQTLLILAKIQAVREGHTFNLISELLSSYFAK